MKFKFKIQQYQTDAVRNRRWKCSAASLQRLKRNIDVTWARRMGKSHTRKNMLASATMKLSWIEHQLLDNIHRIQGLSNIPQSKTLVATNGLGACSLDIEMETGTGKTYVYIKTMFELNKRYGWTKFIVVVPSIAIREGVAKSFAMLEDHFMEQYSKKAAISSMIVVISKK
jgi:type III restriction enzyme